MRPEGGQFGSARDPDEGEFDWYRWRTGQARTNVARVGVDVRNDQRRFLCERVGADALAGSGLDLLARRPAVERTEEEQVGRWAGTEREEVGLEVEACVKPRDERRGEATKGGQHRLAGLGVKGSAAPRRTTPVDDGFARLGCPVGVGVRHEAVVEERGRVGEVGDPVGVREAVVLEQGSEELEDVRVERRLPVGYDGWAERWSAASRQGKGATVLESSGRTS